MSGTVSLSCFTWRGLLYTRFGCRRWWLAGGVTAVISILQRTLGHFTESSGGVSFADALDTDTDSYDGATDSPVDRRARAVDQATPVRLGLGSQRGVRLPPLAISDARNGNRLNTNSWLFSPASPTADEVAQRSLEVLYQVALVAAGDEGVGGGSGGRISGQSGQRSSKVYTPAARIFQTLASPRVVAVVALVRQCVALRCSRWRAFLDVVATRRACLHCL